MDILKFETADEAKLALDQCEAANTCPHWKRGTVRTYREEDGKIIYVPLAECGLCTAHSGRQVRQGIADLCVDCDCNTRNVNNPIIKYRIAQFLHHRITREYGYEPGDRGWGRYITKTMKQALAKLRECEGVEAAKDALRHARGRGMPMEQAEQLVRDVLPEEA